MTDPLPLPEGFSVGHWSDPEGLTGCSVVIPPPGTRGGVSLQGGGPGTRETDTLNPLSRSEEASAVLLTGGSAFGLAAADGVVRWLEQHEMGYWTPAGRVPLVPSAVIYDLASGDPKSRPGPEEGYAACEHAHSGVPERGAVGVGTGATVAKLLGRERGSAGGFGYGAIRTGPGETVAAAAAVNAAGDVIAEDGSVLAGPRADDGEMARGVDHLVAMEQAPEFRAPEGNTTLVCVCTDAALTKRECGMVARAATAGIARAVDPTFTPVDGDVVFCLASGTAGESRPLISLQIGAAAATATAAAIRDAVRMAGS
ncbi:MAG TPA: P1 family peptidase [Solirubrobacterales bacterium]